MNKLSSQYILDIIRAEMNLLETQTILRDQNFEFPGDKGLYVVAGIVDSRPMSSESQMADSSTDSVENEIQTVQMREVVQIDISSRSNEAVMRNWEVIAALTSFRSQRLQDSVQFKIFRIPERMINTSSAEGSAFLNRYTLTFVCFSWYRKTKAMASGDYYDDFTTRLDDAKSIGTDTPLAEFEITEEGITQ